MGDLVGMEELSTRQRGAVCACLLEQRHGAFSDAHATPRVRRIGSSCRLPHGAMDVCERKQPDASEQSNYVNVSLRSHRW
jgi:hypothetical protein